MSGFQLFTAAINADNERCVNMPGFSHHGEPWKNYGGRLVRTIYFFARNRTQAARHLAQYLGVTGPCSLDGGRRCAALEGRWLQRSFDQHGE